MDASLPIHPDSAPSGRGVSPVLPVLRPKSRRAIVLVAFAVLYFALELGSSTQRSATYDEPLHLAAGYAALAQRDHRMDPSHPPFVRMWAALPLLGMAEVDYDDARIDPLPQEKSLPRQNTFAHDFLYGGHDADRLLNWGRFMIMLLGVLLGGLIFCWTEAWLGLPAAALALVFYLLSPNLGAHAALVTTDLGVTCFYFGTVYFLWRTQRAFTRWNIAGLAAFFSLAMVSKFSAVLLIPTCALLAIFSPRHPGGLTWRRIGGLTGLLAATAWLTVWTVYGFHFEPSQTPGWLLHTRDLPDVQQKLPVIAPVLNWIDAHHLLPNAFTQGFLLCFSWSDNSPGFLAGEISTAGWWYYYPVAILVKTPVVLLALGAGGLGVLIWRLQRARGPGTALFVVLPAAIYLGFAMSTGINLGLRHILPVYPFVILLAAVAGREILAAFSARWTKFAVLGTLLGLWTASFAGVYPHTLTFFNWAAGGPQKGSDYLTDSNLDWGQHLKLLKNWMDERSVERINFAYFGLADPTYHGIACTVLPGARDFLLDRMAPPELPGYVAISETVASGVYLRPEWRRFYAGFETLVPEAVLGNTLKIYRVETWPQPDPPASDDDLVVTALLAERLRSLGWSECSIPYYRQYLAGRPDDLALQAHLAQALFDSGHAADADAAARRAEGIALGSPRLDRQIALTLIKRKNFNPAIEPARTLTRWMPNQPLTYDLLGIALAGDGQLEAARENFETAVRLDPHDPALRRHLERAKQQLGNRKR